jgi:hypothetical protein
MTVKKPTRVSQLPNATTTTLTINIPFGNLMETRQENVLRMFLKNVNGIHKGNSWEEWKLLSIQSQKLQIDILSLTETNYNWNSKVQQFALTIAEKYTKECLLSTLLYRSESNSNNQPGGTATAVLGNATGRIAHKITYSSSMLRWSGFKLHTNRDSLINIITVYQCTKSDGLHTNYMYQTSHMKNKAKTITPTKLFTQH